MSEFKILGHKLGLKSIVILAVVAAVYVAVTVACGSLSYANIQFRISEALVLLCFYKKSYCVSMVIGCFIANIASTVGLIDMIVGTAATVIAVIGIVACSSAFPKLFKRAGMNDNVAHILSLIIASLCPVVANAVLVGLELYLVLDLPLVLSMIQVGAGELVCVTVLGTALFWSLEKNKQFMRLIEAR
ncbi:MAG: QueT transporter family protein [Ruminococcus sp.]|nr:QueT transporter family protein [Ruminococcus sp.]